MINCVEREKEQCQLPYYIFICIYFMYSNVNELRWGESRASACHTSKRFKQIFHNQTKLKLKLISIFFFEKGRWKKKNYLPRRFWFYRCWQNNKILFYFFALYSSGTAMEFLFLFRIDIIGRREVPHPKGGVVACS